MGNKSSRFTGGGKSGYGKKAEEQPQQQGGRPVNQPGMMPGMMPMAGQPVAYRPAPGGAAYAAPGPKRFTGGGVALGSTGGGGGGGAPGGAGAAAAGAAAAARLQGTSGAKPAKAAPTEEQMVMRMFIDSQLSQIEELIESINGAPPELVVPALELLIKIYGAIIDKPDEPKVRKIRCSNEKFLAHLGGLPVAMNFLEASGFIQTSLAMDNGAGMEDCIVFPKEGSLSLLRQARAKIVPVLQQERPKLASAPAAHGNVPAASPAASEPPPPPASSSSSSSAYGAPLIDFSDPPPAHAPSPAAAPPASGKPPSEWAAFEDGGDDLQEATHRVNQGDEVGGGGEEERQIVNIQALFGTIQGADVALLKPALDLLVRVASAILKDPGNVKLRSIKRRGAAFQKIEVFESLIQIMQCAGFEFRTEADGESVVLPQGSSQYVLGEMKSLCEMELQRISPAAATCAPAPSSPAAAFHRETAVFTRVDGGLDPSKIHVPDSYFEFTSQDLKASTSTSGVHLTRTMKEAMKPQFKFALIRVRFTDGYILQGKFRAGEKVDAIKAWVDGCLNTPERLYTLSTMPPVRKVTGKDLAGKTLNELGLAPGTLVNFFWADGINEGTNIIRRELMSSARPLTGVELPRAEGGAAAPPRPTSASRGGPGALGGGGGGASQSQGGGDKIPAWMQKR